MMTQDNDNAMNNILIVDDTPNNLRLLSAILETAGYDVRKATNGKMALDSVVAEAPDLILLDIRMPEMSGYEVCQHLKQDQRTQPIPVIFISALDDVMDKVRAFSTGGVDYIIKPFQPEEVLARVQNQLRMQLLQRELEKKNKALRELNANLVHANENLERFSHMVSHDLKQPLQSIMGFCDLIALHYKHELNESVIQYLERIHNASDRMQDFIQDLLDCARSGEKSSSVAPVSCTQIMAQVIENLQGSILKSGARINYGELPTVIGNETQLIQVFQNLVGNALKYAHSQRSPEINIFSNFQEEICVLRVQDNGIGIAPEFIDQIFEPFQQIHPKNTEGHGVGLSTCQRILKQHNGTISVTSEVDQGSTFVVTLPTPDSSAASSLG